MSISTTTPTEVANPWAKVKLRLFITVIAVATIWALGAFLIERGALEQFVTFLVVAAVYVITAPKVVFGLKPENKYVEVWNKAREQYPAIDAWFGHGSKLSTILQGMIVAGVALGINAALYVILDTVFDESASGVLSLVITMTALNFGLAFVNMKSGITKVSRFAVVSGEAVKAIPVLSHILNPVSIPVIAGVSFVKAVVTHVIKALIVSSAAIFFNPLFGVVVAGIVILIVAAPEFIHKNAVRMKAVQPSTAMPAQPVEAEEIG